MKKFDIPKQYQSVLIKEIKEKRRIADKLKKDFSPTVLRLNDDIEILLARHFGFCYGVENAVEIAYQTILKNPGKRVYFLSEMIHNPEVNEDLKNQGVQFLISTSGDQLIDFKELISEDIVIVPAFGTTIEIQTELERLGINPYQYDTTCPFVEKVWNRSNQISKKGYTVIIHGKPDHEETRATFSHASKHGPALILKNIQEAKILTQFLKSERPMSELSSVFTDRISKGFDPDKDLRRFGVVNQTTMLASDTQEITDYLKNVVKEVAALDEENIDQYFANTRDTLCYATNDNQQATLSLLKTEVDIAIVVGGYNSSNTSHLVEILESKFPTYFINNKHDLLSPNKIRHFDIHMQKVMQSTIDFDSIKRIILTCGASCPDRVVEQVLHHILKFKKATIDTLTYS